VFDNGGWGGYGAPSAAFVYGINDKRRDYSRVIEFNPVTFEIVWEYINPPIPSFFNITVGASPLPQQPPPSPLPENTLSLGEKTVINALNFGEEILRSLVPALVYFWAPWCKNGAVRHPHGVGWKMGVQNYRKVLFAPKAFYDVQNLKLVLHIEIRFRLVHD
jgi:hypothetical protein